MEYMLCYPSSENMNREHCEKVHNILARMSERYKLRIEPEPVKSTYYKCPDFYHRFKIYKPLQDSAASGGEAYLSREEEEMILSVCRSPEEEQIMKDCIYAYPNESGMVLKAFRDRGDKRARAGRG